MQCSHCGREVQETRHLPKAYRVDYYRLHTGQTEWTALRNPQEDAPSLYYLKLTQPLDIISCTDCYGNPQIRRRLEDGFNSLGQSPEKKPTEGPRVAEASHG